MKETELIGEIQKIRDKNNKLWMQLLKLAMLHAPKEAKDCLRKINCNDKKISNMLGGLVDE